jgi:hypothetical protein
MADAPPQSICRAPGAGLPTVSVHTIVPVPESSHPSTLVSNGQTMAGVPA